MERLKYEKWLKSDYEKYILYLKSLSDELYKNFHGKLTTTKYEILGIRVPIQRKIAKIISKGNIKSFLEYQQNIYYEEVMIKGFVIASIKDKDLLLKYLENYISLIDNWAICDSFCNSLKIINEDENYWFSYFSKYLESSEEFRIRVGLIVFLNFYVKDKYLEKIFSLIDEITIDKYYINMGIAWFLCECFIKYRDKTLKYLLKSRVNTFTFNKTISKIKDSCRVSLEDKKYLQNLKRKDER